MSKRLKATEQEDNLQDAFNIFDESGNGEIVASNLFNVLSKLGENITLEEINEMISQIDINGDGKIDYSEFVQLMTGKTAVKNKKEK